MLHFLDPLFIIRTVGIVGVIIIIFAESGLLVGFFLPGDSLLFTAGFLASQDFINIWVLLVGAILAAIVGDSVGYAFGKKMGDTIFTKKSSRFFSHDNVMRAKEYYDKFGKKTIILARFIPVVRTFAPSLAGVAEMEYKTFLTYNVVGGFLWSTSLVVLGYVLGNVVPDVDKYILPIVIIIVVVSIIPGAIHLYKDRKKRRLRM